MAVQITTRYKAEDGRSRVKKSYINNLGAFGEKVTGVSITDVYTIDKILSKENLEKISKSFYTPLLQQIAINKQLAPNNINKQSSRFSFAIEIGYLPGVTDNIGRTSQETIEDVTRKKFKDSEKVYTSQILFLSGKLTKSDVNKISLALNNPLIQRANIKSFKEFMGLTPRSPKGVVGMDVVIPKVNLEPGSVDDVNLMLDDKDLATLGKAGVPNKDESRRGPLGLGVDELKAIRTYFYNLGRNPTDIEIETLAQTWSEHCKHTIFANPIDEITEGLYKRYIKGATRIIRKNKGKNDFCVSVFSDNSGIIKFDNESNITHKVETHNTPSALDPFGGAITGIVGVNRDTIGTGLGAKPILNFYGYCFAEPNDKSRYYRDLNKTQELLSARRIMDGVIGGVNEGGNQSGIPTPQGFVYFEKRYRGKPLVFVGTVGLLPRKVGNRMMHEKKAKTGDYIVMVGGRVGLDGIHGATFSSEALDAGSPATAVQIGDAITQKKLSDAIVKDARDKNLYSSITDNGAGGLSSSIGEMAKESGGCEVWLDKVPLKYPGLSPWQTWISESQERMTLSVPKSKWNQFKDLMNKHGTEATIIGEFTDSQKCVVKCGKDIVIDLDMEFMHEGIPVKFQKTQKYVPVINEIPTSVRKKYIANLSKTIKEMISRSNLASTEFISSQYDHEVQGVSVTKPLQGKGRVNASASVSRPKLDSKKGVVMSQGLCPRYSDIDTYHMAASAIDQSIRNIVATGADPDYVALLDNFCWCSSLDPKRLYQLKKSLEACFDYAISYNAPFISGKDSMFNDFKGFTPDGKPVLISVPPTLLISSISVIPDIQKVVTLDFKKSGDTIYLLGETKDELGRSEYEHYISDKEDKEFIGKNVPTVDAEKNLKMYRSYYKAVQKDLVTSAIPLDRGGLGIALVKSAMAGKLGADVDLGKIRITGSRLGGRDDVSNKSMITGEDVKLFSESNGRILVSVSSKNSPAFEKIMSKHDIHKIGQVTDNKKLSISNMNAMNAMSNINLNIEDLLENYRKTFKDF